MVSAESIGIDIGAEIFFAETDTLFFSSNFTHFFLLLGEIQVFYKLENKPIPSKII